MRHSYLLLVYAVISDCLIHLTYGIKGIGAVNEAGELGEEGECLPGDDTPNKSSGDHLPEVDEMDHHDAQEGEQKSIAGSHSLLSKVKNVEDDNVDVSTGDVEGGDEDAEADDGEAMEYTLVRNIWSKPQLVFVESHEAIEDVLNSTRQYMKVYLSKETSRGKYKCRNYHGECSFWATEGHCAGDTRDHSKWC
jgi:hypothetical protein